MSKGTGVFERQKPRHVVLLFLRKKSQKTLAKNKQIVYDENIKSLKRGKQKMENAVSLVGAYTCNLIDKKINIRTDRTYMHLSNGDVFA